MLLVNNLTTGAFDLYEFPATSPSRSFSVAAKSMIVKQSLFAERATVAVCGSDNGRVYIFDISTGKCLQILRQEEGRFAISTLAFNRLPDAFSDRPHSMSRCKPLIVYMSDHILTLL